MQIDDKLSLDLGGEHVVDGREKAVFLRLADRLALGRGVSETTDDGKKR
jgi:hypothetical protein